MEGEALRPASKRKVLDVRALWREFLGASSSDKDPTEPLRVSFLSFLLIFPCHHLMQAKA